jgi:glycosyltransferase involved in cell wall biosynthesis
MKKVSVITPTIGRESLQKTIESVKRQTYPNVEHIIIADGVDVEGAIKLGRQWGAFNKQEWFDSTVARIAGILHASGDYICYLDDDDEYLPHHIETLVKAIEDNAVDFAWGKMDRTFTSGRKDIVGDGHIDCGFVSTGMILHKVECFQKVMWNPRRSSGYIDDHHFYKDLAEAGYTYKFVDEITMLAHVKDV